MLETYGGEQRNVDIIQRRWKRPVGVLSIQTFDAVDRAPDGIANPAHGVRRQVLRAAGHVRARRSRVARARVPHDRRHPRRSARRRADIEAVKGFEYLPDQADVEIKPDEVTFVTLKLKPMTDMSALGWYSGSTHMHMNYGGNLHNTLENLMLMSAAEDQDVVNELVANKDNRILDYQYLRAGRRRASDLQARSAGHRRTGVPAAVLRPRDPAGPADHLLSPCYDRLRRHRHREPLSEQHGHAPQGESAGCDHRLCAPFGGDNDPLQSDLGQAKGFIVDAALKTTDGIEWSFSGRAPFFPWYAVLNNGLRVTGTGGEDSMSDLHISKLVGSSRTYVYTGSKGLDARAWMDGLRDGRAFMSTGPLVGLTINGRMPGDEMPLPAAGGTIEIAGWVKSIAPLDKIMLIANGEVIDEIPLDRRPQDLRLHAPGQGLAQQLVPSARRRQTGRAPSARHRLCAGLHQPDLGERRRPARAKPGVRRVLHQMDRQAAGAGGGRSRLALAEGTGPRLRAVRGGAADLPAIRAGGGADQGDVAGGRAAARDARSACGAHVRLELIGITALIGLALAGRLRSRRVGLRRRPEVSCRFRIC